MEFSIFTAEKKSLYITWAFGGLKKIFCSETDVKSLHEPEKTLASMQALVNELH